jgi:hypothetical protein
MSPGEVTGWLTQLFKPWADYYGHSKVAVTVVTYAHIGALLFAGGLGIAMDRATLRAFRGAEADRTRQLTELDAVHPLVVGGLVLSVVSGVLFLCADVETFMGSWVWWTKFTLVVLLLANGGLMVLAERSLRRSDPAATPGWTTLRRHAVASLILWFSVALAGVTLVNTT